MRTGGKEIRRREYKFTARWRCRALPWLLSSLSPVPFGLLPFSRSPDLLLPFFVVFVSTGRTAGLETGTFNARGRNSTT